MKITPPIMFHQFVNDDYPYKQGALTEEQLDSVINYIGIDNIIPAQEWLDAANSNKLKDKQVCLTFDDALKCQYEIAAPVLSSYNLTGIYFICTAHLHGHPFRLEAFRFFRDTQFDSVDEFYEAFYSQIQESEYADQIDSGAKLFDKNTYLSEFPFYSVADKKFRYVRDIVLGQEAYFPVMEKMIGSRGLNLSTLTDHLMMNRHDIHKLYSSGNIIGLHSYDHPTYFTKLSNSEICREYKLNHENLISITGQKPTVASFPCNSYNQETFNILKKLDVTFAFRSNSTLKNYSQWELPREDIANIIKTIKL